MVVEETTVVETPAAEAPASNAAAIAASDAAAAAPEDTSAKRRGFYAGGSVGGSFFDGASNGSRIFYDNPNDNNGDGQPDAFSVDKIDDESNFMWSVFGGYRLSDWLGAEVGWTDLGGFRATDVNDPTNPADPPHNNKTKVSVDGLEARLRAWVPLGTDRISGIGGVGIFIFSSNAPKSCAGPDTGGCTKGPGHFDRKPPALNPRNDSGQAFTISAGLQFRITDNVLLRTEYQHFFNVLDQGVNLVTASLVFGFYDFFGQGREGGDAFDGVVVE
ncbi:MAG: outer membrane beta-barrel protein [Thioalkalivibrio sp.]|nr:outer membrane beta-barrel protein [Thioalkalivibrio sp.]